jgi:pimeloyl-ACP methyl ester carboxylesterase
VKIAWIGIFEGLLAACIGSHVSAAAASENFVPGLYGNQEGHSIYAAIDIEDNKLAVNYLDPKTQRFGTVTAPSELHLQKKVNEKRVTVGLGGRTYENHECDRALRRNDRRSPADPAPTLERVTTPTLALFGALDRSVDSSHAAATLQKDFAKAGMRDFKVRVYKNAGHSLVVSKTGYEDQPASPLRCASDYPQVMIDWLRQRGFLTPR